MRIISFLFMVCLCAGVLTAGENKTVAIGGKEFAIPSPKLAKFDQAFNEERHDMRSTGKSPFIHDLSFVRKTPHTHVVFSYYHLSHMADIPGIEKITFSTFRAFVKEIKGTLANEETRSAFIATTNRKFAEKYPEELVDIDASNIEDAGAYYGYAIVYSMPDERYTESSLYFFHDDVIFRLSIDDFNSKNKEDSFAMLVQWMHAFLELNN